MKTISTNYKLTTNGKKIRVSLVALFRAVGIGGEVSEDEVPGNVLDTLRVQLVRPGVTGAEVLTADTSKPCHYYLDGSMLDVSLAGLTGGVHRLTVLAKYGTNCHALLIADLEAPANVLYLEAGDVVMPLARMAEKDTEVDGVKYYAFAYEYGNKLAWLLNEQPQHLRGTVEAYYVGNLAATFEDATKMDGARLVMNKPGELVYDNGEIIALSPVDTFGSVGGGLGGEEHVIVSLTVPYGAEPVNWEQYNVTVEYLSQGRTQDLPLNASGICDFNVPSGEQYLVVFPKLVGYVEPISEHFTAVGGNKKVHYVYRTNEQVERVIVLARNDDGQDISALIGQEVKMTTESGYETAAVFDSDLKAILEVAYGEKYTVRVPTVDGWHPRKSTFSGVAGILERYYIVHYVQAVVGAYGIDDNGRYYTEEEINQLEDKTIIKYIGYNDSELDSADRGDGNIGCGFMFEIPVTTSGKFWTTENVQLDSTLLPNLSRNYDSDLKSEHNTKLMHDLAEGLGISSPAADYALAYKVTVGGEEFTSVVPAFGIWSKIMSNWYAINAISIAAGRGNLPFKNGIWWSSTQANEKYAHRLVNGNHDVDYKITDGLIARFFNLYI